MLIALLALLLAVSVGLLCLVLYLLAANNLFFAFVKEGAAKIVMRGESFHRVIISLKGYKLLTTSEEVSAYAASHSGKGRRWDVVPLELGEPEFGSWLNQRFRIFWIGIPPFQKIHRFKQRWVTWKLGRDGKYAPSLEEEWLDQYLLIDYVYHGSGTKDETAEKMPVNVVFLISARSRNPHLTAFGTKDWLRQVMDYMEKEVRTFVGQNSYEDLLKDTATGKNDALQIYMKDVFATILADYGVEITVINLLSVEPPDTYVDITTKAYTSAQEAKQIVTLANADKEARIARAEGEAEAIQKRKDKMRDKEGKLLIQLDTLKEVAAGSSSKIFFPIELLSVVSKVANKITGPTGPEGEA